VKIKSDDVIFLIGVLVVVVLVLLRVEIQYVGTVAGLFGSHKVGSIFDDKFPDRIDDQPRFDAQGKAIE
jgi:hypothetical protein